MASWIQLSATDLLAHLTRGEVSSVELCRAFIERLEKISPHLNAVVWRRYEQALEEADESDQRRRANTTVGPLHGLPVTIKEMFDVAGTPTTAGIRQRSASRATRDAECVRRWREAGAIILAKTNVPQLGVVAESDNPVYGRTNNPWDIQRSPGGSSGGEAAVLAADGSPLGLASDGGGSIRQPSHACGISGLKPTGGRFPMSGHWLAANWPADWAQPGPMARTTRDVELGFRSLIPTSGRAGYGDIPPHTTGNSTAPRTSLRVGYYETWAPHETGGAIRRAVLEAKQTLEAQGITVIGITPLLFDDLWRAFQQVLYAEGMHDMRQQLRGSPVDHRIQELFRFATLPKWLRPIMAHWYRWRGMPSIANTLRTIQAPCLNAVQYCQLLQYVQGLRYAFSRYLDRLEIDALIGPPSPVPAWTHDVFYANETMKYTAIFNVLGVPAGVVPVTRVCPGDLTSTHPPDAKLQNDPVQQAMTRIHQYSEGLPVGVQVVGRWWQEEVVLQLMHAIERPQPLLNPTWLPA